MSLFSQKIIKKIQLLSFTESEVCQIFSSEKVKDYIEKNLKDELSYFQKKYSLKIDLLDDESLIIPEYRIHLLNKSKKIINVVENINYLTEKKTK